MVDSFEVATPEMIKEISEEYNIGFQGTNTDLEDKDVPEFSEEVNYALKWLSEKKSTKNVTYSSLSSYAAKHMVESWTEKTLGNSIYVSTGAMSIAAIIMKYPVQIVSGSPNTRIGISKRSLTPMDGIGI